VVNNICNKIVLFFKHFAPSVLFYPIAPLAAKYLQSGQIKCIRLAATLGEQFDGHPWHRPVQIILKSDQTDRFRTLPTTTPCKSSIINSLNGRYTHDNSMCTVCIQTRHKRWFIRVPVKATTKHFELEHLDVYGPFCKLTLRDNQYLILFFDDYT
jgi:hypothetical protein